MHFQFQRFTRLPLLSLMFAALLDGAAADLSNTNGLAPTNSIRAVTNSVSSSNRMADLRRRIRQEQLTNGIKGLTNSTLKPASGPLDPLASSAVQTTNKTQAATNRVAGPLPLPSPLPLPGTNATSAGIHAQSAIIPTNRMTVLPGGIPGRSGTNRTGLTNLAGPKTVSPNPGPLLPGSAGETNGAPMVASGADDIIESVDLQLDSMPLPQFLDVYGRLSHRTIIRASTLPVQNLTLTAETALTRKEAIEAMDGVLAQNGITMIPIGEKFVKAVTALTAQQEGAPISETNVKDLPEADQFVTRIVKLKAAKAMDVAPLFATFSKSPTAVTPIESNNTLILRDYSANVKRMLDIIQRVDVLPESDFKLEVVNIKYGKVEDIYATMSALISGGGGGGAGAIPGAGAAQRQGGRSNTRGGGFGGGGGFNNSSSGFGGGFNSGGFNNQGSGNRFGQSYYPQSDGIEKFSGKPDNNGNYYPQQAATRAVGAGSVAGNAGSFQGRLNNVVRGAAGQQQQPEQVLESANIVPDYRSNRLLIFANKHDMEMITNLVSKVDTLLAQVLIEAIIMEVEIGDSQNVGVSMASSRTIAGQLHGTAIANNPSTGGSLGFLNSITNLPTGAPNGFSYVGALGNDLDFVVNAIASSSTTKVVSRPRIQTSHAIPGSFFLGQTLPYVTGATDYGAYGAGLASRSTVSQAQIGFGLNVTPFITPEGLVVMEIDQTFDTVGNNVIIDSNPIPIINNRQASSTLTVRSGDTIMMGGFIKDQRDKNNSGIPFLKDIPGIGALFRSKSHSNDRTELIVLMRATVLDTPEAAAVSAAAERAALPGIRQAEREFQEEDNRHLKKDARKAKGD